MNANKPSPFAKPGGQSSSPFGNKPTGQSSSPFGNKPTGQSSSPFGNRGTSSSPFGNRGSTSSSSSPFGSRGTSAFGSRTGTGTQVARSLDEQIVDIVAKLPPANRVLKHGDDRDNVVMRLNFLQELLGQGEYLVCTHPSKDWETVPVDPANSQNVLKGFVYNVMTKSKDADGRVGLRLKQDIAALRGKEEDFVTLLNQVFEEPNYTADVESISQLQNGCVEVVFRLMHTVTKQPMLATKVDSLLKQIFILATPAAPASTAGKASPFGSRFGSSSSASKPSPFGNRTTTTSSTASRFGSRTTTSAASTDPRAKKAEALKQQGIEVDYDPTTQTFKKKWFYPLITPPREEIEENMARPPSGVSLDMWRKACADNPDPFNFNPVLVLGFEGLKRRAEMQAEAQELHQLKLSSSHSTSISERIRRLSERHAQLRGKIERLTARADDQSTRILKLMKVAALRDRVGSLQEYKALQSRFAALDNDVTALYRGKVSEIQARVEMYGEDLQGQAPSFQLSEDSLGSVHKHLEMQQEGLEQLFSILDEDAHRINIMEMGYQNTRYQ